MSILQGQAHSDKNQNLTKANNTIKKIGNKKKIKNLQQSVKNEVLGKFDLDFAIVIEVNDDTIVHRIGGRRVHLAAGRV